MILYVDTNILKPFIATIAISSFPFMQSNNAVM